MANILAGTVSPWEVHYDRRAPTYDENQADIELVAAAVLHYAAIGPGDKGLLDLGCATGELLKLAAGQAHPGLRLGGVDFSAAMVGVAKSKLDSITPRVTVLKDDVLTLCTLRPVIQTAFPEGISIIIATNLNLERITDHDKMTRAIDLWMSLLNPDGRLIISHNYDRPNAHCRSVDDVQGLVHLTPTGQIPARVVESFCMVPPVVSEHTEHQAKVMLERMGVPPSMVHVIDFHDAVNDARMPRPGGGVYRVQLHNTALAYDRRLLQYAEDHIDHLRGRLATTSGESTPEQIAEWESMLGIMRRSLSSQARFLTTPVKPWQCMESLATKEAQRLAGERTVQLVHAMDRHALHIIREICQTEGMDIRCTPPQVLCRITFPPPIGR